MFVRFITLHNKCLCAWIFDDECDNESWKNMNIDRLNIFVAMNPPSDIVIM